MTMATTTLARPLKLALVLIGQLTAAAVIYIFVASEAGEFARKHLGTEITHESGEEMFLQMVTVLSGVVVTWCLGGLRTVRGILLGLGVVVLIAAVWGLVP
jgi:hypothetical protein